jgi:two-component system, cell cycle response regulator DivK
MQPSTLEPLVVLVDAHADTLALYKLGLEQAGFRVLTERHAADALYTARAAQPAAVVTELVLPDISGTILARALRDMPETAAMPVIALTSVARNRDLAAAERAGCTAVLVKPCLPSKLAETLRRVIQAGRESRTRARTASARVAMLRTRSERVLLQSAVIRSRHAGQRGEHVPVPCPGCEASLAWREHQLNQGVRFDYFHPCPSGCGEYYFHHGRRLMRVLR